MLEQCDAKESKQSCGSINPAATAEKNVMASRPEAVEADAKADLEVRKHLVDANDPGRLCLQRGHRASNETNANTASGDFYGLIA